METYEEETKPLIDFYEERNLLRVIPSSAPIEEVYDRVKGSFERSGSRAMSKLISDDEVEKIRQSGKILAEVIREIKTDNSWS